MRKVNLRKRVDTQGSQHKNKLLYSYSTQFKTVDIIINRYTI